MMVFWYIRERVFIEPGWGLRTFYLLHSAVDIRWTGKIRQKVEVNGQEIQNINTNS